MVDAESNSASVYYGDIGAARSASSFLEDPFHNPQRSENYTGQTDEQETRFNYPAVLQETMADDQLYVAETRRVCGWRLSSVARTMTTCRSSSAHHLEVSMVIRSCTPCTA